MRLGVEAALVDGALVPGDVALEGGRVSAVGLERNGGTGIAVPGFVDLHTHLREPGREYAEDIETGSAAAALGGYAAVFAMATHGTRTFGVSGGRVGSDRSDVPRERPLPARSRSLPLSACSAAAPVGP